MFFSVSPPFSCRASVKELDRPVSNDMRGTRTKKTEVKTETLVTGSLNVASLNIRPRRDLNRLRHVSIQWLCLSSFTDHGIDDFSSASMYSTRRVSSYSSLVSACSLSKLKSDRKTDERQLKVTFWPLPLFEQARRRAFEHLHFTQPCRKEKKFSLIRLDRSHMTRTRKSTPQCDG